MSSVRIIPLGGLGEIGMNCLALEQRGEVLVIDCGVTFDHRGLGVDVIHPSFEPLAPYQVAGLFITHGHEDHIGAVPYFLRRFDAPVWGPKYALGLLRERAAEHEILRHGRFIESPPGRRYQVGSFIVEPIRVTHSIPDATALAIETDAGTVVHTGDFKFDPAPPDGEHFDEDRVRALGDAGVALLLSDSTNVDARGTTGSEAVVGEVLGDIVANAREAVVVSLFASNIHRLRLLGDIAERTDRKIVQLGRSVATHARVARSTGYLPWRSDLVHPLDFARDLPRRRVLGLATGSQAEPNAALARLARGEFSSFELKPGDMVIWSSRIIPGHEPEVYAMMGEFLRRQIEVRSWISDDGVHVSGHAHRIEQERMLRLVRPRAFIPVHGTLHHLTRHAAVAREAGVEGVCVLENGDVGVMDETGVSKRERVSVGRVHVFAGRPVAPGVLKERASLAAEGVVFVVVPVDAGGRLAGEVTIVARGVLDLDERQDVVAEVRTEMKTAVAEACAACPSSEEAVAEAVRLAARRTFGRALGYKPATLVTVQRVSP